MLRTILRTSCGALLCLTLVSVAVAEPILAADETALEVYSAEPVFALVDLGGRSYQLDPIAAVNAQRVALIHALQQLQDTYCKAGMLDAALAVRSQIRRLEADAEKWLPTIPVRESIGQLQPYQLRGRNGEVHYLEVTGSLDRTVWGSGPYTDDSYLGTAAVHSGQLQAGQTGLVVFRILPGREAYTGSTANGVSTYDYHAWGGSYEILGVGIQEADFRAANFPDNTEHVDVIVTGKTTGYVWGTGPYTNDSDLGTAAVHAGILQDGETGLIRVELRLGQESYDTSSQHGVTTWSYGPWEGSLQLERLGNAPLERNSQPAEKDLPAVDPAAAPPAEEFPAVELERPQGGTRFF